MNHVNMVGMNISITLVKCEWISVFFSIIFFLLLYYDTVMTVEILMDCE